MKIKSYIILVLVISFGCATKVFAEYDKYLITKETVAKEGVPPEGHWQDTICIVHEGEILEGKTYTYYGVENPNYIIISPDRASRWGVIPSDCARIITQEEIDKIEAEESHSVFKWYMILYSVILVIIFVIIYVKNRLRNIPKLDFTSMNDKDRIILESKLEAFMDSEKKNRFTTKNILRLISSIVFVVFVAYLLIHFSVSTEITLIILSICAIPMYFVLYRIFNVEQDSFSFSSKLENDFYGAMEFTFPADGWTENIPKKFDKNFSKWLLGLNGGNELLRTGRIYYGYKKTTDSYYKDKNIDKLIFEDIMSEVFNNFEDESEYDE